MKSRMMTFLFARQALLLLFVFMIAGGLLSVYLGKELSWDIANYHYYNPYAVLNQREQLDFWPSSFIHQYLNPTIDFLSYFLITYFSPRSAEFTLGAIHAINAWLIFLIARTLLPNERPFVALIIAILGMYDPIIYPGIGSFSNDNLVSIFILSFVLLQLKTLDSTQNQHWRLNVLSGVFLGAGLGLKLTAGTFLVSGVVATLLLPLAMQKRFRHLLGWSSGAVIGFLIVGGYWMMMEWSKYHNPFFPFFNNFFHSSQFSPSNWRDERFLPHGWQQLLFYPWYFSFRGNLINDVFFQDFRLLMTYCLFIIAGVKGLWNGVRGTQINTKRNIAQFWLYAFVIGSYVVWQWVFSIARYLAPIEMVCPLLIYLLVAQIIQKPNSQKIVVTMLFTAMFLTLTLPKMIRARWYDTSYFNIHMPDSIKNVADATVLIAYPAYAEDRDPRPQSYLIPFFPQNWHFIGTPFWRGAYLAEINTSSALYKKIYANEHPIYLLTSDYNMPELYHLAARLNLQPNGPCESITSDRQVVAHQQVLLCPVSRK